VDIDLGGADTDEYNRVEDLVITPRKLVLARVRRLYLTDVELAVGFLSKTLATYLD